MQGSHQRNALLKTAPAYLSPGRHISDTHSMCCSPEKKQHDKQKIDT